MFVRMRLLVLLALAALLSACANQPTGVEIVQTSRGVEIRSSDSILFDSGKYNLRPRGNNLLDKIARMLNQRTKRSILVEGHTDNVGDVAFNQDLSEVRALTVMKALIDRGVQKYRLSYKGYGMTRPLYSNATEEGRSLNRRTDIVILGERKENIEFKSLGEIISDFGEALQ